MGIETPSGTPTIAESGSGTIDGDYIIYTQFGDADGNWGPLGTASATTNITVAATLTFGNLPRPTEGRVTRRRILRNTAGQTTTFYVDLDTDDLWSTSLTSTKTDSTLSDQEEIVLFTDSGVDLTGQWTAPRTDKPILAPHKNRMFAAGEVTYSQGNAQVTFGSTTVTGTATAWTSQMAGRDFFVIGQKRRYSISSVSESAQTLTLSEVYHGATDLFSSYMIQPPRAQRAALFYSESNNPDGWPSTNYLLIVETGDVITALIPSESFLYIGFRQSIFRFTFESDPSLDGSANLLAYRGVVNQRCWIRLNGLLYVLDRLGVYVLQEGGVTPISQNIQDMFSLQAGGTYKIDWSQSQWFHAAIDPENSIVKFFVAFTGANLPRYALCYHTLTQQWHLEKTAWGIGGATVMETDRNRVFYGGPAALLLESGQGKVDGPNPTGHTLESKVTASTLLSVTCPELLLPASGLVNHPVAITEGKGKGQVNWIDSWTDSTKKLVVTMPWLILPDTTSRVQVGAIPYEWKTGWYEKTPKDHGPVRFVYDTTDARSIMNASLYLDFSDTAVKFSENYPVRKESNSPVSYAKNEYEAKVDLRKGDGQADFSVTQIIDDSPRHFQLYVHGFAGADGVLLHSVEIGAAIE